MFENKKIKATHKVHGVRFIRTGYCNQCDGCEPDCMVCPHGERKGDGKIYWRQPLFFLVLLLYK